MLAVVTILLGVAAIGNFSISQGTAVAAAVLAAEQTRA
jgi:hypothetical protein